MGPLLPVLVLGGSALAYWKKPWQKKMTPERKALYETAMRTLKDPAKLRDLANAYDKEGLKIQAKMLRKRATCIELPEDVKKKHRECFEKAMASTNVPAIEKIAGAFENQGQTIVAGELRKYAEGLKAAEKAQ
jgi:hypothetical protein